MTRRLTLALCVLLACAADPRAQMPDTTDWRAYFPLEVGNQWQYFVDYFEGPPDGHYGYEVSQDTLIEGRRYFSVRTCSGGPLGEPSLCSDGLPDPYYNLVHYDTTHALVAEHIIVAGAPDDVWWEPVPCALDAPFEAPVECSGPLAEGWRYFISGGPGYNLILPPDTVRGVVYKEFDSVPVVMGAVAGFGVVSRYYTKSSPRFEALIYARVGGAEYGTPAFAFPTAAEPPAARSVLAVRPNPSPGGFRVTFLPEGSATRLEVHDVRGRRVLVQEVVAVPGRKAEVALDLSGLAQGLYVVRVIGGRGPAAALLSVLR